MKLFPKQHPLFIVQILFGLFASTRGYTILVLIFAQYLSARYILAPQFGWHHHLTDKNLLALVFASSFAIAGGYLINNFYDAEKDRINRPQLYLLHQIIGPTRQLQFYAFFNAISLFLAFMVNYKALLFFLSYIGGIWLYSHFLKKRFWASNLFASFLAIIPFFAIALYYHNFSFWVMCHAFFLFLIVLVRDIIKDLQNFKGDWVRKYHTIAVVFGKKTTKYILSFLIVLAFGPVLLLLEEKAQLGKMYYYFLSCLPVLFLVLVLLWSSDRQKTYLWIHNILKALLLAGVGSIVLVRFPLA